LPESALSAESENACCGAETDKQRERESEREKEKARERARKRARERERQKEIARERGRYLEIVRLECYNISKQRNVT